MKLAICHYSFHRRWKEEGWHIARLTAEVRDLGVNGIDYHAGLLGDPGRADEIRKALDDTGLELAGVSLSNNFNRPDPQARQEDIDTCLRWMEVAAELGAPVCRIFGGHVDRSQTEDIQAGLQRVVEALGILTPRAEALGVVLALENHGGLPCTGAEQAEVIRAIDSPALRATVDVGNYMQCGQDPAEGTAAAAPLAAYVHIKDNRMTSSRVDEFEPCIIGAGSVDIPACCSILRDAGYDGYLALEFEGTEGELEGVPQSIEYMKNLLQGL